MTREQAMEKARDFIDKSLEAYESFSGDLPTDLADVILAAWREGMEEAQGIAEMHEGCPVIRGGNICGCDRLIAEQIREAAKATSSSPAAEHD